MNWRIMLIAFAICLSCSAAEPRIVKVLPHLLDQKGREALSPSLYERDAYQFYLRHHPDEISALRFDVQWKCTERTAPLKLKIQLRGSKMKISEIRVIEKEVKPGRIFSQWSKLQLDKKSFDEIGEIVAWRASLWDGEELLAEQKSFLY